MVKGWYKDTLFINLKISIKDHLLGWNVANCYTSVFSAFYLIPRHLKFHHFDSLLVLKTNCDLIILLILITNAEARGKILFRLKLICSRYAHVRLMKNFKIWNLNEKLTSNLTKLKVKHDYPVLQLYNLKWLVLNHLLNNEGSNFDSVITEPYLLIEQIPTFWKRRIIRLDIRECPWCE